MDVKKILKEGMFWGFIAGLLILFMGIFVGGLYQYFESINIVSYTLNTSLYEFLEDFLDISGEAHPIGWSLLFIPLLVLYYTFFIPIVLLIYTFLKEKNILPYSKDLKPFSKGVLFGFTAGILNLIIVFIMFVIGFTFETPTTQFHIGHYSVALRTYFRQNLALWTPVFLFIDAIVTLIVFSIVWGIVSFIRRRFKRNKK